MWVTNDWRSGQQRPEAAVITQWDKPQLGPSSGLSLESEAEQWGHGHHPPGRVWPAPGLLLQEHLQPLQPPLQVPEAESPKTATVSVRKVSIWDWRTILTVYTTQCPKRWDFLARPHLRKSIFFSIWDMRTINYWYISIQLMILGTTVTWSVCPTTTWWTPRACTS